MSKNAKLINVDSDIEFAVSEARKIFIRGEYLSTRLIQFMVLAAIHLMIQRYKHSIALKAERNKSYTYF